MFFILYLVGAFLVNGSQSFSPTTPLKHSLKRSESLQVSATRAPEDLQEIMKKEYSEEELKEALDSLLHDSDNPDYDGRHIFGYGDPDHKLSMLQKITATRILDYREMIVSTRLH